MQALVTVRLHESFGSETTDDQRAQHMWNILRGPQGRAGLGARELAMLGSTESTQITEAQAATYMQGLADRGRLRPCPDEGHFFLPNLNRLKPLTPRLMQVQFLLDPNEWFVERGKLIADEVPL